MKIKTSSPTVKAARKERDMGALALLVATVLVILLAGLLFWWLIPVATAGAVGMTFVQGVALAAVLNIVRVLFATTSK